MLRSKDARIRAPESFLTSRAKARRSGGKGRADMGRVKRRNSRRAAAGREAVSGSEKRTFSRVPCLLDLEIEALDAPYRVEREPLEGGFSEADSVEEVEAIDLSLLGLGFSRQEQTLPLELGDEVAVRLFGHKPVKAQVKWNTGDRVGIQFSGPIQEIIESWVGDVLAAQGVRWRDVLGQALLGR